MWIISKSHREKNFFFYIFAIHSSSRHEKHCQMFIRLFAYFNALKTNSDQQETSQKTFQERPCKRDLTKKTSQKRPRKTDLKKKDLEKQTFQNRPCQRDLTKETMPKRPCKRDLARETSLKRN